jgi:hypothetical protein
MQEGTAEGMSNKNWGILWTVCHEPLKKKRCTQLGISEIFTLLAPSQEKYEENSQW